MIALSATFTADSLKDPLAYWLRELGFSDEVQLAPYNQVFQSLLDPASPLAVNRGGINIVLIRFEDWAPDVDSNVKQFLEAVTAASSWPAPLIVAICPASPSLDPELQATAVRNVADAANHWKSMYVVTPSEVARMYPVAEIHDPDANELGHIPYTRDYFAALATALARKIHSLRVPPFKVIAVDCDDTLWKGICGEDGPAGVTIDPARRALQEFLIRQHDAGMLLCICSKNNQEDVFDTFRAHPAMPLSLGHFVAWRINWDPKPLNLRALAEELELGLDTFILIDDSAKECTEVRTNCPEVLTLQMPATAAEVDALLRNVWAFDHLRVTEEDRQRTAMYARQVERGRAERESASLEDFIRSLQLEIEITPMTPAEVARVSQLTQRTNQMNFTTVRRTEAELQAILAGSDCECLTVHVSDRFGSYGLAGVMILKHAPDAVIVDTFLLSCRALGRGVEHRMIATVGEIARERGLSFVEAPFVRTQRNAPALLFLESIGLNYQQPNNGGRTFRFPAEYASKVVYKPAKGPKVVATETTPVAKAATRQIDYLRIAAESQQPAKLAQRVRSAAAAVTPGTAYTAPRSELERKLAEIWEATLQVSPVGIRDNFFDLGGHSLLAVELLSRVRKEVGAEVSLEVVYGSDFTVEELARAIEMSELADIDSAEYAAMLAEVENLSDEEVRELLANESGSCESS